MTTETTTSETPTTETPTTGSLDELIDLHLQAYADADAARRSAIVERIWSPTGELVDPPLEAAGHEGIAALADAVLAHFPGHGFRRTTVIDTHHDRARYGWALVAPDGSVALTGTDVVELTSDGRLARVTGFFGELAPA